MSGGERKLLQISGDTDSRITSLRLAADNMLQVSVGNSYGVEEGQKFFGPLFKGTVKSKMDTSYLLAQLESVEQTGRVVGEADIGKADRTAFINRIKNFSNVDVITSKNPFESFLSSGKVSLKDIPVLEQTALLKAASLADNPNYADQSLYREFLQSSGFKQSESGKWVNSGKIASENLLKSFESFAKSKDMSFKDLMGRLTTTKLGIDSSISMATGLLSPELHRSQMGIGGLAPLSQRGFLNIASIFSGEVSDQLMNRAIYPSDISPQSQIQTLNKYKSLVGDKAVEGISEEKAVTILDDLFRPDLAERKALLGQHGVLKDDFAVINLKSPITLNNNLKIQNIVIPTQRELAPHIGEKIGSNNLADLDLAARDLTRAVLNQDTSKLEELGSSYLERLQSTSETLESSMFKAKYTGSMYSQAASELFGMREFAGAKTPEGLLPPVIAMHERDIARQGADLIDESQLNIGDLNKARAQFVGDELTSQVRQLKGQKAVELARSRELWGLVNREPSEGLHRSMPALIGVAEDFGAKKYSKGITYFSGLDDSTTPWVGMRKALGLDFDADATSVIMFTDQKAKDSFNKFWYGGEGEVAKIGEEFRRTQKFYDIFKLKGSAIKDFNALEMSETGLQQHLVDIGLTEKKLIGPLSSEFKDIHAGFRQVLSENKSPSAIASVMRGETFSLLALESALKAKHQSSSALRSSHEILDILRGGDVQGFQSFFDKMAFGSESILGAQIRTAESQSLDLISKVQTSMGFKSAKEATDYTKMYKELTESSNIEEVFSAKARGKLLRQSGYLSSSIAQKSFSQNLSQRIDSLVTEAAPMARKALSNIGKFAILPAAGLGLLSSVLRPESPVIMSAKNHENTTPQSSSVSFPGTKWLAPNRERYTVKGRVMSVPSRESLSSLPSSNVNLNINDYRQHMTQDYIERKIERGF
jgi:hypothetical protein